ncbi:MAG: TIGR02281 family clan AA aspartic protease [Deltaproteobacteria bacterium]|nr:TIGR02281 family clan AA aspartic protease [Deltaproteobacteria bacterium]
MRLPIFALLFGLIVAGFPTRSGSEIYRWTDERGQIHFTQDLRQVPPDQRLDAEDRAQQKPGVSPVQIYDAPPARRKRSPSSANQPAGAAGRIHRILVQRAGNSMRVSVRINDQLDVPFVLDTGASDVVLPAWAAEKMGLDLSNARTGIYGTANGVIEQKIVTLRSVSLQGARVENVPASVSESMSVGLLGLTYFNHFKYHVDPGNGVVTLQRNQLAESGVLKGGRSAQQWTHQFGLARRRIELAEKARDEVPSSRSRQRKTKQEAVERLERELDLLEREADDAHVPFTWRD